MTNPEETGSRASDASLLVFVHIRKTAGLTLRHIIHRQYPRRATRQVYNYFNRPDECVEQVRGIATSPPPELRLVHGHMLFWPELAWPEGTRFFTLLRDPVERAISHYSWTLAKNPRFPKSLEQAVADGAIPDNLQTRVVSGTNPPFGQTSDAMLERALENLGRCTVVGLTERFDESLALLTRAFGWRRLLYRRANVTPDRQPREELSSEALELIERHNALDRELYRHAENRFERDLAQQGDALRIEVEALQRASVRAASMADDASLDPLPSTISGADGRPDDPLDLRDALVEAQAELLIRDWQIERVKPVFGRPVTSLAAQEVNRAQRSPEERAAGLAHAIEQAKLRLEQMNEQIRSLEEADGADAKAKLEALRSQAAAIEQRLRGFERRSARTQGGP